MPYDLQEIEKCVRDSVVLIPSCYACAYCNKISTCMSMRTSKGLLYIKKKTRKLTQMFHTGIRDLGFRPHIETPPRSTPQGNMFKYLFKYKLVYIDDLSR